MGLAIEYVLFDLDGTLTDSGPGIMNSARYALKAMGVEIPDQSWLRGFIGPPLRSSFMEICGLDAAKAEEAVAKYREYFAEKGIYENELYPGVAEMLQTLRGAGKTLVLATSKAEVFSRRILEYFDIAKYFAFVSASEWDGARSEKAEIIRYALENISGVTAERCVMVGDRSHDIIGAKAAGVRSVGVLYGYGGRQELERAGPDYIVGSVAELTDLLMHV